MVLILIVVVGVREVVFDHFSCVLSCSLLFLGLFSIFFFYSFFSLSYLLALTFSFSLFLICSLTFVAVCPFLTQTHATTIISSNRRLIAVYSIIVPDTDNVRLSISAIVRMDTPAESVSLTAVNKCQIVRGMAVVLDRIPVRVWEATAVQIARVSCVFQSLSVSSLSLLVIFFFFFLEQIAWGMLGL